MGEGGTAGFDISLGLTLRAGGGGPDPFKPGAPPALEPCGAAADLKQHVQDLLNLAVLGGEMLVIRSVPLLLVVVLHDARRQLGFDGGRPAVAGVPASWPAILFELFQ